MAPQIPGQYGNALLRLGWGLLAAGFLIALVAAVILGRKVESLETPASAAHALSKVVMLGGLLLILAGYRRLKSDRTDSRQLW